MVARCLWERDKTVDLVIQEEAMKATLRIRTS